MNTYLHPQKLPRARFRRFLRAVSYLLATLVCLVGVLLAYSSHYERTHGGACASCHEIWQPYSDWHTSAHRGVPCADCHGDVFTLNAGFHINNMRRVFAHLSWRSSRQAAPAQQRCVRHGAALPQLPRRGIRGLASERRTAPATRIFFSTPITTTSKLLMDDCLRCHGMHFEGGIRDLVTPLNTVRPVAIKTRRAEKRARDSLPHLPPDSS